jgi:MFS transporter, PPP family, 3-phenylpropionic acid transporter
LGKAVTMVGVGDELGRRAHPSASHAMRDSFAVIRWGAAGIGPGAAGFLWSESVAAEVVVFFIIGRPLLDRLDPAGAAALAAAAGMVRWSVEAQTAWLPAMAAIQPLHGLTFALLHLANMRVLAETVPPRLAGLSPSPNKSTSDLPGQSGTALPPL